MLCNVFDVFTKIMKYLINDFRSECFCGENGPPSSSLPDGLCGMKCSGDPTKICGGYFTMNIFETGVAS